MDNPNDKEIQQSKQHIEQSLQVTLERKPNNRLVIRIGLLVLLVFIGGLSLWSVLAPIESAAIASGKVVVTGNRRTIQHLEGGIVQKINVSDGENVHKGQLLVTLENTHSKAAYQLTLGEIYRLLATEGRLIAERDNDKEIHFNERLISAEKEHSNVASLMAAQQTIFNTNEASFDGNISILNQQISQLKEQIKGSQAQLESIIHQYGYIQEELVAVKYLANKKLIEKPKLLELQRSAARLQGSKGETMSRIAVLHQQIGETETKIHTLTADRLKNTLQELRETYQNLADLMKKEAIEQDILTRTEIRSPQNGTIVGLNVHTVGGVIQSGESLMDIVPDEKLVIEARVSPLDIDIVHPGLIAKVQLVAFKTRNMQAIQAKVVSVSADAFTDETTGEPYYKAKIELDHDQLQQLEINHDLYPGMPVQVMIITDKRTFFSYLFSPIQDSFKRSFREQ